MFYVLIIIALIIALCFGLIITLKIDKQCQDE